MIDYPIKIDCFQDLRAASTFIAFVQLQFIDEKLLNIVQIDFAAFRGYASLLVIGFI